MLCAVWLMCGSACLSDSADTVFKPKFHLSPPTLFSSVYYYPRKQHRVFGKLKPMIFFLCTRISRIMMDQQESSIVNNEY